MNIHICHLYVLADPDNSKPYTDIPQRTRKMDQLYKKSSVVRNPQHSRLHPMIPRLYVPEWKTDMKNRTLIMKNAEMGNIPHHEHDENLFLEKREQMSYNVEDRYRVEERYEVPTRRDMLRPDFAHTNSKYQSEIMYRKDEKDFA